MASSGGGAFGQNPRSPPVIRPAGGLEGFTAKLRGPSAEDVLDERHAPAPPASDSETRDS